MTVQELLKDVDMDAIANIYDLRIEDWEREIMAPKEAFRQDMAEFVKMLLTLTPDGNADPDSDYSGGYVMAPMPYLYIYEDNGSGEIRIEAEYIRKADWDKAAGEIRNTDTMPSIGLGDATHDDMEAWLNDTDRFLPQGWAYDFTPWEKVLAAEIVPGSFYDLPGTTGKKTKDLFLYDLLWNLSFNGYTREHQNERREELEKSIDETERILALPEEEQKNYFHDADDVLRGLCEELGMEYHEQTEIEKELLRDNMLREGCITREERLAEMWRLTGHKKG